MCNVFNIDLRLDSPDFDVDNRSSAFECQKLFTNKNIQGKNSVNTLLDDFTDLPGLITKDYIDSSNNSDCDTPIDFQAGSTKMDVMASTYDCRVTTEDIVSIAVKATLSDIMMYTDFEIVDQVVQAHQLQKEDQENMPIGSEESKVAVGIVAPLREEEIFGRGGTDKKSRGRKRKQQEVTTLPPAQDVRRSTRIKDIPAGFYNEKH